MIIMNSPMACLVESDKLQAKLYAQAQIDLDHLAQNARKWLLSWGYSIL